MNGTVSNFRGSHKTKKGNQIIVIVDGVNSLAKAKSLVGKSVVWSCAGKKKTKINGKISSSHGNKGAVRVIFERGLPGQSLGTKVDVQA